MCTDFVYVIPHKIDGFPTRSLSCGGVFEVLIGVVWNGFVGIRKRLGAGETCI